MGDFRYKIDSRCYVYKYKKEILEILENEDEIGFKTTENGSIIHVFERGRYSGIFSWIPKWDKIMVIRIYRYGNLMPTISMEGNYSKSKPVVDKIRELDINISFTDKDCSAIL